MHIVYCVWVQIAIATGRRRPHDETTATRAVAIATVTRRPPTRRRPRRLLTRRIRGALRRLLRHHRPGNILYA